MGRAKGGAATVVGSTRRGGCAASRHHKSHSLKRVYVGGVEDGEQFSGGAISINTKPEIRLSHEGYAARLPCVLNAAACETVIRCAEAHADWKEQADSVDGKAEWQHTIVDFARRFSTQSLGGVVEALAEDVVLPGLKTAFGLDPASLYMHWAFVRAYSPSRRLQFPVHRDSSVVTANILLSPPSAFSGAELYVLGPAFTGVDKLSDREFRKKLPEAALRREHSLDYQQGECVMHLGKRMHGVLPITKGTRHTLILMFYEKK